MNEEKIDISEREEFKLAQLRNKREVECFRIINRGKLWYDTLNEQQLNELNQWYNQWLNITQTKEAPVKPSWLR